MTPLLSFADWGVSAASELRGVPVKEEGMRLPGRSSSRVRQASSGVVHLQAETWALGAEVPKIDDRKRILEPGIESNLSLPPLPPFFQRKWRLLSLLCLQQRALPGLLLQRTVQGL